MNNETYLVHHGVKGMRWGVRRYQKFDGTYTRKGLERHAESVAKLNKAKETYKAVKKDPNSSSYDKKYAKAKVREAKRQEKKDYKHLRQDMLGDKGKVRYNNGQRITYDRHVTNALNSIGGLSLSAATYARANKIGSDKVHLALAAIGTASLTASGVKYLKDEHDARELRAYYNHSSNRRNY